jgi:imidazolonepropionase-like amidohydrolase
VYEGGAAHRRRGSAPIDDSALVVVNNNSPRSGTRAGQGPRQRGSRESCLQAIIPAIIDSHTHLAGTRDALVDQLRPPGRTTGSPPRSASARTPGDLPFQVPGGDHPQRRALPTAGAASRCPEPGRTDIPYWITSEAEARKAVQELAVRKVDIVKIWVDDRNGAYKKLTPALYGAIIDEAHKHQLRVAAHIFALEDAKGCCAPASTASRTASATRTSTTSSWRCSSSARTSS